MLERRKLEEVYGENVFSDLVMKERLPEDVYGEFRRIIDGDGDLSLDIANKIAAEMKRWALEKGATHYCHWFQPLTGVTAEKHDAFLTPSAASGKAILTFSGKDLIKGESDASSFPSGGLRATFEARGYTAWDCTSPAFVREDGEGITLYIPTAFCSYTGESLDKKTPLLRSMQVVNREALRLLRLFGNTTSKRVVSQVGAEQEYFIVDREKYLKREDLVFTGRTLFGAAAPKGQEMDDHYMGTIPERVGAFMKDVNEELWKLGIPAKTEHNEAAPAQHELAPVYEETNIATDHNQLIMEILKRVAGKHNLMCLLHEKPFRYVNGSGKHNNWSLVTDDGINLFNPGKEPHDNLQFLLILSCIMSAVDKHAPLLIESSADVGNEERLGGNEAPPRIISMFLGTQLEDILHQLEESGDARSSIKGGSLDTGVSVLPALQKDAADRNRTSPFAFTGNKFEFRAVGSMDSIAEPNVVLNTIAAESFSEACDILEKAEDFESAVRDLIRKNVQEHSRILFSGNNYSEEWQQEAVRRGLPIINSMVEALGALSDSEAVAMYKRFGIYTETELQSRAEIGYETYIKAVNIEARAMIDIAGKKIIPAVIRAIKEIAECMDVLGRIQESSACKVQRDLVEEASLYLNQMYHALTILKVETTKASEMKAGKEQAERFRDVVVPAMEALRKPADQLESIIDKDIWPMPTYSDLMFEV